MRTGRSEVCDVAVAENSTLNPFPKSVGELPFAAVNALCRSVHTPFGYRTLRSVAWSTKSLPIVNPPGRHL